MRQPLLLVLMLTLAAWSRPPSASVAGAWRIEDVNGGGVIDSSRLEITFGADGAVSGYGGCNNFSGRYAQRRDALDIGPLAATRRACLAEALTLQEARVLQALDAVSTASFQKDGALVLTGRPPSRLLLRRADGAPAQSSK